MLANLSSILLFLARTELRGKYVTLSALLFLAVNLFIFYFSMSGLSLAPEHAAPPVLWVTYMLFMTMVVSNLYARLSQGQFLTGLFMTRAGDSTLFLSIVLFSVFLTMALTLLLFGLYTLFFSWAWSLAQVRILGIFFLSSFGLVSTAVLINEILAQVRFRDILLPILHFPLTLPLVMASVSATIRNIPEFVGAPWVFLLGINLILFFSSLLLYDFAKEELG